MLILLITFVTLNHAHCFSIFLGTGGITPHFSGKKKNYCNQWNNTGIIVNKSYYIRLQGETHGTTLMTGNDSICSKVDGIFYHYMFYKNKWNALGITTGAYAFNMDNWQAHADKTPSGIAAPSPVHTKIGDKDVVPVLALEWQLTLIYRESWSLKLMNLITPIITNHSIAVEIPF